MRRRRLHGGSADQFIGKQLVVRELIEEALLCPFLFILSFTSVAAKSDRRIVAQNLAQPFELIVSQGIHWVQQQGSYAGFVQRAGSLLTQQVVQDQG